MYYDYKVISVQSDSDDADTSVQATLCKLSQDDWEHYTSTEVVLTFFGTILTRLYFRKLKENT